MSVINTVQANILKRQNNLIYGTASVAGDASGGHATVAIRVPKHAGLKWLIPSAYANGISVGVCNILLYLGELTAPELICQLATGGTVNVLVNGKNFLQHAGSNITTSQPLDISAYNFNGAVILVAEYQNNINTVLYTLTVIGGVYDTLEQDAMRKLNPRQRIQEQIQQLRRPKPSTRGFRGLKR